MKLGQPLKTFGNQTAYIPLSLNTGKARRVVIPGSHICCHYYYLLGLLHRQGVLSSMVSEKRLGSIPLSYQNSTPF